MTYWGQYDRGVDISVLIGKIMKSVENITYDELVFETIDGEVYKLLHFQDCCECVQINDIVGDLDDLVGYPILISEEVSGETGFDEHNYESYTWTFYKFATIKGYVDVRWLGTSNGYYSESVDFVRVK